MKKRLIKKMDKNETVSVPESNNFDLQYPMFQDTHVMVLVGFGFLMTFLKRYAFSALGFTFLIVAFVIPWGIFWHEIVKDNFSRFRITITIETLINGDILAAAVLISFGAVLGKISPFQLIFMAAVETVLVIANEYIGVHVLQAVDAGGSMFIHAFGAYFGLAVSFILGHRIYPNIEDNKLEGSIYQSDINSMIGTLFLWLFWPSFNAGLLTGEQRHRAVIHTYLALCASCITTFCMSAVSSKSHKYKMVHIQNATLAGGVCVGTSANMVIQPFGALIIGGFAGVLSTVGFVYIQGPLLKKLHIHDTCGVNNLHGMPGIVAGLIGAITAAFANNGDYGNDLNNIFPAMADNRTALTQAGFQIVALGLTLIISIIGGLITGCILWKVYPNVSPSDYHNDDLWWEMENNKLEP